MRILIAFIIALSPMALSAEESQDGLSAPPPIPKNEDYVKKKKKHKAKGPTKDSKTKVIVHEGKGKRIEEYRVRGHLTKVKVISKYGKPYYIYYDEKWNDVPVKSDLSADKTPFWKIFSW